MIKKILYLLLITFVISSFNIIGKEIKRNKEKVKKDKILLVGKVTFEPEIKQNKHVPLDVKNGFYLLFLKDDKKFIKEFTLTEQSKSIHGKFNEYFTGWVNKDINYLRLALTAVTNSNFLYYRIIAKLNLIEQDQLVYIGDLYFKTENNNTTLKVVDNYEEVKKEYDDYVVNEDGTPIKLQKRLLENDDDVGIDRVISGFNVIQW